MFLENVVNEMERGPIDAKKVKGLLEVNYEGWE
jgi:hypothetical protein